jgi:optic atrophy 3 protein
VTSRAIENGANTLAEGFLFTVAAALIIAESWRSSRKETKRRDTVDDKIDELGTRVTELTTQLRTVTEAMEERLGTEKQRYVDFEFGIICLFLPLPCFCAAPFQCGVLMRALVRNDELTRILERIVEIGLRGGWAEFQDTPLRLPRIHLSSSTQPSQRDDDVDSVSHSDPPPPSEPDDSRIDKGTPPSDKSSS